MNRPAAVNVDEASPFEAQAFFEAIPSDPERAMALLCTQVPSDGPPTPRAAVFLENGESNYREFRNLVEHVREESITGRLAGKEVRIFTDNSVTERAWCNGTSSDKVLFELVLDLRHKDLRASSSSDCLGHAEMQREI